MLLAHDLGILLIGQALQRDPMRMNCFREIPFDDLRREFSKLFLAQSFILQIGTSHCHHYGPAYFLALSPQTVLAPVFP